MTTKQDDYEKLDSWSFIADYRSHSDEFFDMAQIVYETLDNYYQLVHVRGPTQRECAEVLADLLLNADLWKVIEQNKGFVHAPRGVVKDLRERMARYIISENWSRLEQ